MLTESSPLSGYDTLVQCLEDFHSGGWRFIQLRGVPLGSSCIDSGDVDLLGSHASVDLLLARIYQWVQQGKCHCRVRCCRPEKVELTLISYDALHSIRFDLWLKLWQLDNGNSYVVFDTFLPVLSDLDNALVRLPMELEAAVYIQHLVCKKKRQINLSAETRLQSYRNSLGEHAKLSALIDLILQSKSVSEAIDAASLRLVHESVKSIRVSAVTRYRMKFVSRLKELFLAAPRKPRLISIMGCDGAGKTSLAMQLMEKSGKVGRVFKGKHLYRKSYMHKLAVIFIRPLLFQSREVFDEKFAPLVYLRACIGLRIKLLRRASKGLMLIDRSIVDFLYLNRKTDTPGFSRFRSLAGLFGVRIPTVHCIVGYDNIVNRKLEMSCFSIDKYNLDMFRHFTGAVPTDYFLYNNDGSLAESTVFLERILRKLILKDGDSSRI